MRRSEAFFRCIILTREHPSGHNVYNRDASTSLRYAKTLPWKVGDRMKRSDLVFWLGIIVMVLMIIILVVVYFVLDLDTQYYQPGSTWIQSPSEWTMPPAQIQHEKAADIKPHLLPAYRIELPDNQAAAFLKPTSDGGCLAIAQIQTDETSDVSTAAQSIQATRFWSNGTVRWTRQYDDLLINGYLVALCVLPDDSFALSLRSSGLKPANPIMHDQLLRFAPDGRLIWQTQDSASLRAGSLDFLLAADDGAVLAAGTVQSSPADAMTGDSDISLIRFEADGRQSATMLVGRSGQDYLPSATYQRATGLVLIWQQITGQTQPGEDIAFGQTSRICCYDAMLQEQWVTTLPKGTMLNEVQITPDGKDILAFGTAQVDSSAGESSATGEARSTLYCLDSQGIIQWFYQTPETRTWLAAAVRQTSGSFVVGWHQPTPEQGERSTLLLLDADGQVQNEIDRLPGIIRQLIPTLDGGVTAVCQQSIQPVPQPIFISSIWTDTEAIVSHYDRTQQLVWRRTIDQYRGVRQTDHVVATTRDTLLVG